MWPIGPLMHEHRLIEQLVAIVERRLPEFRSTQRVDSLMIDRVTEFFRMYADRCHHGKEEDILFKSLETRDLSPELTALMAELIEDHRQGREMVGALVKANQRYAAGEAQAWTEVVDLLERLIAFYPRHIEKEDKHFFFPVMEFYSGEEKDAMLAEFSQFDARLIHEFFGKIVASMEASAG
jgi:hemerythrin-like domain-containing protein